MIPYWDKATYLLEIFLLKLCGLDIDGIDLCFTAGGVKVEGGKQNRFVQGLRDNPFIRAMNSPAARPKPGRVQELAERLRGILNPYTDTPKREHLSREGRTLALYILTDGIWKATGRADVDDVIMEFYRWIAKTRKVVHRIRIHFVLFGDDPEVASRMKALEGAKQAGP